ncbi:gene transfer agent family protein [Pelagibacterium mangrovi]|uniref:gene transfer agent family protein n=1 Tax=Pelagibacterium mangrovi TaxID=3119828 RepID=UPI002FCAB371
MNSPSHTAFFWDQDRVFCLSPDLIIELERKTGHGIGELCRRLFRGDFRHLDLLETIRLALIGGGTDPKEASALIASYAATQPLGTMFALAVQILEVAYFGAEPAKTTQEGSTDEK